MLQNRFFFALAPRPSFGAAISGAVVRSSIVFSNSVAADRNVMAASRFLAAAAVSSVDHAPVRAVIGRAMAVEEKKAMAVMPNELTKAGKLDSSKRVVGRIVEVEEKDANYTCYLVCGLHRKDTLQIDAWQEHKGPARRELTANRLVSITNASLVLWKGEKQKYSLSASRFAIRFDKNLGIASAENEKNEKIAGGGSLALKDLPMHFPVTSLKVAACLKEATVARISVIDTFHKQNTTHSHSRSFEKRLWKTCMNSKMCIAQIPLVTEISHCKLLRPRSRASVHGQ